MTVIVYSMDDARMIDNMLSEDRREFEEEACYEERSEMYERWHDEMSHDFAVYSESEK